MSMPCPACGTSSNVRTSRPMSVTVSEQYLHCLNPMCQCVFKTLIHVSSVVGHSLLPESEIPADYFNLTVSKRSDGNSKWVGLPPDWAKNTSSGKRYAAHKAKKATHQATKEEPEEHG